MCLMWWIFCHSQLAELSRPVEMTDLYLMSWIDLLQLVIGIAITIVQSKSVIMKVSYARKRLCCPHCTSVSDKTQWKCILLTIREIQTSYGQYYSDHWKWRLHFFFWSKNICFIYQELCWNSTQHQKVMMHIFMCVCLRKKMKMREKLLILNLHRN